MVSPNLVHLPEQDRKVTYGRRVAKTKVLKSYAVWIDDKRIGTVSEEMATFESKTPGRRYVNYRWQSTRWFFYPHLSVNRRSAECSSRKQAIEGLIHANKETA